MSDPGSVALAYLHPNDVGSAWHKSVIDLLGYDLTREARIARGAYLAMKCGAGGLDRGRSMTVEKFLDTDAEWLFWVDSDMGFAPDTVERLLAVADQSDRPIVGALCFALKETTPDGMGGYRTEPRPTIFDWVTDADGKTGFQGRAWFPVNEVVQCAGTGSACILIHRSVLEKMHAEHGPTWYDRIKNPSTGDLIGEDLSFCVRAGGLGFPIHVHTGVRTTHQKTLWLGEPDWWAWAQAPPATDQVAVIVPVMRRPQNAEPFMRSLRASTGLATVYAVADSIDMETCDAWQKAGAEVIVWEFDEGRRPGTFAEKVNVGYSAAGADRRPWLFLTGDDVRFHPGWLDHAQAVAGDELHVVGTNDLVNPRVLAGEHATHLLIRRRYVDDVGASWDGPGVVAHEGYRHWFVDNELVTAARQRGAWGMALGSRVEHLHPLWGTAPDDETYRLGQSRAKADAQLFKSRLRQYADAARA